MIAEDAATDLEDEILDAMESYADRLSADQIIAAAESAPLLYRAFYKGQQPGTNEKE